MRPVRFLVDHFLDPGIYYKYCAVETRLHCHVHLFVDRFVVVKFHESICLCMCMTAFAGLVRETLIEESSCSAVITNR